MKKRILSVLLIGVLACMQAAGCKKNVGTPEDNAVQETEEDEGETEETGTYIFGFSCIDMENPYYGTLKQSIQTVLEEQGDKLIVKDPGSDAELQIAQIQELIEAEVDAVFLCPVDWEQITPALEALKEADIPVINVDTQVKDTELTAVFVGSDNNEAGKLCGEDLKKRFPDGGEIVILECHSVNSINERITSFEEVIANAGFAVLSRADVDGKRENAKAEMLRILAEYPKISAVMCGNDRIALGVLDALEETGRSDMLVYGVDGSPEVKAAIAENGSCMEGTAAQSPINMGKEAVKAGIALLSGEDYEEQVYVDTFFINKENVEMYGTDGWE